MAFVDAWLGWMVLSKPIDWNASSAASCSGIVFTMHPFLRVREKFCYMSTLELPAEAGVHQACPVCGGEYSAVHVNRYKRLIAACRRCGHHFVANPWPELEVAGFYQGFEYFSKNYEHQGVYSLEEDAQWAGWVGHRMHQLETFCLSQLPGGQLDILEQGCLEGRVLSVLSERGHRIVGCDVNAQVAQAGREHFGIDIRIGSIETCGFEPESFDLIYSFHTLEHLRDPILNLAATKVLLKPGGMVFFEIPLNETAYENRDHLHFFSLDSVSRVMNSLFKNFVHKMNCFNDAGGTRIESILVSASKE